MPHMNGYSIYVGSASGQWNDWIVRVYSDSDDTHVHSSEDCPLNVGLREAEQAITAEVAARRGQQWRAAYEDHG